MLKFHSIIYSLEFRESVCQYIDTVVYGAPTMCQAIGLCAADT